MAANSYVSAFLLFTAYVILLGLYSSSILYLAIWELLFAVGSIYFLKGLYSEALYFEVSSLRGTFFSNSSKNDLSSRKVI